MVLCPAALTLLGWFLLDDQVTGLDLDASGQLRDGHGLEQASRPIGIEEQGAVLLVDAGRGGDLTWLI